MAKQIFTNSWTVGERLTRAGNQNGPLFHTHFIRRKQAGGTDASRSSLRAYNQANKAAAITAGSFFTTWLYGIDSYPLALIFMRFAWNQSVNTAFNWAIELDRYGTEEWVQIATGTKAAGTTSGNLDFTGDEWIATGDGGVSIRLIVWGAGAATTELRIGNGTNMQYTADIESNSAYPFGVDSFREVENRPGVVYDPLKKTSVFAEDQTLRGAAIAAVQTVLGFTPNLWFWSLKSAMGGDNFETLDGALGSARTNIGYNMGVPDVKVRRHRDFYVLTGLWSSYYYGAGTNKLYIPFKLKDLASTSGYLMADMDGATQKKICAYTVNTQNMELEIDLGASFTENDLAVDLNFILPRQLENYLALTPNTVTNWGEIYS